MRSYKQGYEERLQVSDIEAWQRHTSVDLDRWERDAVFAMDRALGSSMIDVIKFHHEVVSKVKTKDGNRDRLQNGRRG